MNKLTKTFLTFVISLIISYLIIGYLKYITFIQVHWDEAATIWDKISEYYFRTFYINIIPSLIVSIIATIIVMRRNRSNI